jgi:multiple sugar transport system substrate-binding protein
MHLFSKGNLGLITAGRWAVMHFRLVGPTRISVCEIPYAEFRNTLMMSGVGAVYEGSKHKELAYYFMKFYASEKYNRQIIENGDGLPPVPRFAKTEAFSRPPKHPNEWGLHDRILKMATEIAIPVSSSLYVLDSFSRRQEDSSFDKAIAGRASVNEALNLAARMVNDDIVRKVRESSKLRLAYEQGLEDQKEIERLRREGELVPLGLITNPFYRRYYVEKSWSLPEGS